MSFVSEILHESALGYWRLLVDSVKQTRIFGHWTLQDEKKILSQVRTPFFSHVTGSTWTNVRERLDRELPSPLLLLTSQIRRDN